MMHLCKEILKGDLIKWVGKEMPSLGLICNVKQTKDFRQLALVMWVSDPGATWWEETRFMKVISRAE